MGRRANIGGLVSIINRLLYKDSSKFNRIISEQCLTFLKLVRTSFVEGEQSLDKLVLLFSHDFLKTPQAVEPGELHPKTDRMKKRSISQKQNEVGVTEQAKSTCTSPTVKR